MIKINILNKLERRVSMGMGLNRPRVCGQNALKIARRNVMTILFSFFALVLGFSCTKDAEIEDVVPSFDLGTGIGFRSDALTKAGVITTENLQNMGVFTYISEERATSADEFTGVKMYGARYEKDTDGIFKPAASQPSYPTPDFSWSGDYHHFYFYAPLDVDGAEFVSSIDPDEQAVSPNFQAIKYTEESSDPQQHTDLLYNSKAMTNYIKSESNIVGITLDHALTKIRLDVVNSYGIDNTTGEGDGKGSIEDVNTEDVTFEGVVNPLPAASTKFTLDSVEIRLVQRTAVLQYAQVGGDVGHWMNHSNLGKYSFDGKGVGVESVANATDAVPNKASVLGTTTVTTSGGVETEVDNCLFLIPQDLSENKTYFVVHYTYDIDEEGSIAPEKRQKIIEFPSNSKWEMGKAYAYVLYVDPVNDFVQVNAKQVDWESTKDILTEIAYTYLYLEKDNYEITYMTDDENVTIAPVNLDVNFSTNAATEDIEFIYGSEDALGQRVDRYGRPVEIRRYADVDTMQIFKPSSNILETEIILNKKDHTFKCTFLPDKADLLMPYIKDDFMIKTGIVSTQISVEFFSAIVVDYTSKSAISQMLGIPALADADKPLLTSNCYIINPEPGAIKEYYIPIQKQITAVHSSTTSIEQLKNLDFWNVQVYAFDNMLTVNQIRLVKMEKGVSPDSPDEPCIKIIIPQNYNNPGNIIISVTRADDRPAEEEDILWTWHLWITDYAPNYIRRAGTQAYKGSDKIYKWSPTTNPLNVNGQNRVHRYNDWDHSYHLDRHIGASAPTYSGHGGLGSNGWLVYQYGRVAPIFGYNGRWANDTVYTPTTQDTSSSGVSLLEAVQNPSVVYTNSSTAHWCNDGSTIGNKQIWNDSNAIEEAYSSSVTPLSYAGAVGSEYNKSIFDPSPLGWMVPPINEYVETGWTAKYDSTQNVQTYTSSSQNVYISSVNIDGVTGRMGSAVPSYSFIWSNTNSAKTTTSESAAAGLQFDNYVSSGSTTKRNNSAHHTMGAPVRPIFQFVGAYEDYITTDTGTNP